MNLNRCPTERERAGEVTCSTLELGEDGLRLAVSLSALLQEKAADMRGPHLALIQGALVPVPTLP